MTNPTTTLTAALTLALAATPAIAQSTPASTPEFLPNSASSAPFSRAVQVGDTLYLAGQLGLARSSDTDKTNGIEAETRRAMERIGETLALYGLTHDALFKCTVWLADIDDFGAFNAVYAKFFQEGRYPVRSTMAVKELVGGAKIEIECTAHNPKEAPVQGVDWDMAVTYLHAGEAKAPNAYTPEEATVCVGRWRLHADAIDDGFFPKPALEAFTRPLFLEEAIALANLFRLDDMDRAIMQSASKEAEARLRKALGGDVQAFRQYFEALGECSSPAETVVDSGE
ncbi:hypothetical protein EH31_05835 [Erythrobacter longus]|uniref:Uncharacterized protein n=1 Tax=Erythrobacter longus TaxID=1044 RepID=A0A074MBM7_ERYLO|nr:RidA family protein [Erythrobacter longus]KEO92186.1 hypothetical protein EH31_05835 [Erythrobacter longus]